MNEQGFVGVAYAPVVVFFATGGGVDMVYPKPRATLCKSRYF